MQGGPYVGFGVLLVAITLILLMAKYLWARKAAKIRWWGWVGLAIILSAELLLWLRAPWVTVFFTPIAWTGYLLLVDALVWSLRGTSRIGTSLREFLALAFWSVPLWLIFEAYNVRLANWTYVGLPDNLAIRSLGYVWSFATIWPAIFQTADFLRALGLFRDGARRPRFASSTRLSLFVAGLVCLVVPVLVPARVGQYLFGAVWVGFALALDPVNYRLNGRSLLGEIESGRASTISSLLTSGLVCGILWEFWNHWAEAKWLYVFPIMQEWKVFEMPLPGYLGFPAFALECFVMYEFLLTLRRRFLGIGQHVERATVGKGGSP